MCGTHTFKESRRSATDVAFGTWWLAALEATNLSRTHQTPYIWCFTATFPYLAQERDRIVQTVRIYIPHFFHASNPLLVYMQWSRDPPPSTSPNACSPLLKK